MSKHQTSYHIWNETEKLMDINTNAGTMFMEYQIVQPQVCHIICMDASSPACAAI